jgi:hypothetical protein
LSLTSQLSGGTLAAWCAARFPGSAEVASSIAAAAKPVRPVRPAGTVELAHWAAIGGAFGARLAALVQPAPPYYALHGLVRAGLVDPVWADEQALRYPTHADLPAHQQDLALDTRPSPTGWLTFEAERPATTRPDAERIAAELLGSHTSRRRYPAEPVLAELLERTRDYQARHAPVGALGSPGAEAGLARSCWLFQIFEDVYRSARAGNAVRRMFRPTTPTVASLRATASDAVVAELVELAGRLRESGSLDRLRLLAGDPEPASPLGIAGPAFVNHWADGDLLLTGPAGSTLLDVKTVVRTADESRTTRWLWQLLGYAWLDVADRYRIRTVGLYLARHGLLLTWPLDDLTRKLLGCGDGGGDGEGEAARAEFRTLATRVLTEEGARLPSPDPADEPYAGPPVPFPRPNGLYVSPEGEYSSYLRFDGTQVADVSSTGSPDQVARWLHPARKQGFSLGRYRLDGRTISFTTVEGRVRVGYEGTVSDDASRLVLTVRSEYNGHRARKVYRFVPTDT